MAGIPPGAIESVLDVLRAHPGPLRRREILGALERNGHRISLAGLNRVLEICTQRGLVVVDSDGVLAAPSPP